MKTETREKIILSFINAWNEVDMDKVTEMMTESVIFEKHDSHGELTRRLIGKCAFVENVHKSFESFSERNQMITDFRHFAGKTNAAICNQIILAKAIRSLQKGARIVSFENIVFEFSGNKISRITELAMVV